MPDPQLRRSSQSDLLFDEPLDASSNDYSIRRKGSRYNIIGPTGRIFNKYKSASVVGPRWEELTHTPWPYQSSAYQPGTRLWQMGLTEHPECEGASLDPEAAQTTGTAARKALPRGKNSQSVESSKINPQQGNIIPFVPLPAACPAGLRGFKETQVESTPNAQPMLFAEKQFAEVEVSAEGRDLQFDAREDTVIPVKHAGQKASVGIVPEGVLAGPCSLLALALPAPRIDLAEQERLIGALRRDPALLFNSRVRQALVYEVEYHRPYARWAQHLLNLLAKYDRRRRHVRTAKRHSDTQMIMAKHIAWQEQQARMPAVH